MIALGNELYSCGEVCVNLRRTERQDIHAEHKGVRKFLGAFAELRKATVSFVVSVRMEQLGSHWTDFLPNLIFAYFSKLCRENSSFIKNGTTIKGI